jgi:putative transposase
MERYQNKYRIASARANWWDYSLNASYFVTLCAYLKMQYFGKIQDGQVHLSEIGLCANECWLDIPKHFSDVILDAFVIMQNHIHGIITINKQNNNVEEQNSVKTQNNVEEQNSVETQNFASLHQQKPVPKCCSQSKNLASVIRGFKIGVTKYAIKNNIDFAWQPRYYDRIIRNEIELKNVKNYITNNPLKWSMDKYNDTKKRIKSFIPAREPKNNLLQTCQFFQLRNATYANHP